MCKDWTRSKSSCIRWNQQIDCGHALHRRQAVHSGVNAAINEVLTDSQRVHCVLTTVPQQTHHRRHPEKWLEASLLSVWLRWRYMRKHFHWLLMITIKKYSRDIHYFVIMFFLVFCFFISGFDFLLLYFASILSFNILKNSKQYDFQIKIIKISDM